MGTGVVRSSSGRWIFARPGIALAIVGGAAAVGIAVPALITAVLDPAMWLPTIGVVLVAGVVISAFLLGNRRHDPFAPIFSIALIGCLGFAGGAIFSATGHRIASVSWGPTPGVLMGFVGLVSLLAGYFSVPRLRPWQSQRLDKAWDSQRATWLGIGLMVVGVVGYIGAIRNTEYFAYTNNDLITGTNSTWGFLASFLFVGLTVLSISCFRARNRAIRSLPILLGAAITIALLPTGIRYVLFYVAVSIGLPYHYHRAQLHALLFPIALIALVMLILPLGQLYRTEYQATGASDPSQAIGLLVLTKNDAVALGVNGYVSYSLDTEFARVDLASVASAVNAVVPSKIGFQYGATFLAIPVAFIPRYLWPDKPTFQFDNEIGRASGVLQPNDFRTSYKYGYFGEAYLNFGWFGLTLGLFLLGIIFRSLYAGLVSRPQSPTGTVVYSLFFLPIATIETPLGPAFGGAVRLAVIVLALLWVLTRERLLPLMANQVSGQP